MPTSNTTPNPINRSQKEPFTVVLKDRDGVPETTTPITWTTTDASKVDIQPDPSDTSGKGRNMVLIGKGPTLGSVIVAGTANLPSGTVVVNINISAVADTPDQSVIECTFGAAVPKT